MAPDQEHPWNVGRSVSLQTVLNNQGDILLGVLCRSLKNEDYVGCEVLRSTEVFQMYGFTAKETKNFYKGTYTTSSLTDR